LKSLFIATSSFSKYSSSPKKILERLNYEIILNPYKRKLSKNELIDLSKSSDCIIAGTELYDKEVLEKLGNLKILSRLGVGLDNIDLKFAEQKKIKVFTTPTSPGLAVSELVLGLMLNISRHISRHDKNLKEGRWKKEMGSLLKGKTLGIIGLGTIGRNLVELTKGFEFKLLAFDINQDKLYAKQNNVHYCSLDDLLSNSDIISVHLDLNSQTTLLIDERKIKLMKKDVIILNTSRGEIIDENALYNSLKKNNLMGAGLDVFHDEPYSGPLLKLSNVILTPHIGSYSKEIRNKMEIEAANNIVRGLNEK